VTLTSYEKADILAPWSTICQKTALE